MALSPNARSLLVGAPFETSTGTQEGTVLAFERAANSQWTLSARLLAPVPAAAENFGAAIAFTGFNDGLIGDVREGSGSFLGAAHLYTRRTSELWRRSLSWNRGAGNSLDFMGTSVLAVGSQAMVGASGIDNGAAVDEGRVFIFS